jgi:hypothetical protein
MVGHKIKWKRGWDEKRGRREGKGETGGGKIRQPLEIARSEQGVQVFSVEMEERRLYMEREKAVC